MLFLKLHNLFWFQDPTPTKALELGDVIEPSPVPFTFETLGWKIVFFLIAVLLVVLGYKIYQNYKKKQYLRDAIAEIKTLKQQTDLSPVELINSILFVLKDTAMQSFGRKEVAGLYGSDWIHFLDSKVTTSQFKADESVILDAVYKHELQQTSTFNKDQFTNKSIHWIQHHAR